LFILVLHSHSRCRMSGASSNYLDVQLAFHDESSESSEGAIEINLVQQLSAPSQSMTEEMEAVSIASTSPLLATNDLLSISPLIESQSVPSTNGGQVEEDDFLAKILSEARSAVPTSKRNTRAVQMGAFLDERTQILVEQALYDSAKKKNPPKMRSTKEVLKLARKVLNHSASTESNDSIGSTHAWQRSAPRAPEPVPEHEFSPVINPIDVRICLSPTESEAEEYEKSVVFSSQFSSDSLIPTENMLNKIDGLSSLGSQKVMARAVEEDWDEDPQTAVNFNLFSFLMGDETTELFEKKISMGPFSHLQCGELQTTDTNDDASSGMIFPDTSLLSNPSVALSLGPPSYAEKINAMVVDPRMPAWISSQNTFAEEEILPLQTFYSLGTSKTVVVHEIVRGNWTWATAWSPDGTNLALATENHHLAVVDASSSMVWRVQHDRRITTAVRNDTTHSIRSIAWGSQFIAVGGTGNAVSILAPTEPYPILHTIRGTGFVGSLDWKINSAVLAIGSRLDKCIIVNVSATGDAQSNHHGQPEARRIVSTVLHTIERKDWVDSVTFSPGGGVLAIGDRSGKLSVFLYEAKLKALPVMTNITDFTMGDAVLSVEWSPDGKWLYAGGEDFRVIVVDTSSWQIVHTIKRDRWVQFIASSNLGSHLAVGGVNSEVTIFDVNDHWKPVMTIELKGLVPLSAKWHPKDQYLALTGQDYSVVAVETTNARHVQGHYLQSISPILEVSFCPDGRMLAVGNASGVITFYTSNGASFVTVYEMVLADGASQSIKWSPNGKFVCVGSSTTLVVLGKANASKLGDRIPPKASGFGVRKVIRVEGVIEAVSIQPDSRYVAVSGHTTRILDASKEFSCVRELQHNSIFANAWSQDGVWFAAVGRNKHLTIYDTSGKSVSQWKAVLALSWGPTVVDGLQYLAYGGEDKKVTIIEIRTYEGTWETVLEIPRDGDIFDLDWGASGMLAVAVSNGTVTVIDLAYLQAGWAVNEMDYNWQRQGVTCFVEIRRSKGTNSMRTIQWIPQTLGTDSLLAIGGTDGALEVIDLTERQRCKGFGNGM
jgi:WD40 repeat protein